MAIVYTAFFNLGQFFYSYETGSCGFAGLPGCIHKNG